MEKFWELLQSSVIFQGSITLLVIGAYVYLMATGQEVPPSLDSLVTLVVGFFFGAKVQNLVQKKGQVNMARYTVDILAPTFVTTKAGLPKKAFSVTFTILEYDEQHTIDVPDNDPETIEEAIEAFIERRDRLASLGA